MNLSRPPLRIWVKFLFLLYTYYIYWYPDFHFAVYVWIAPLPHVCFLFIIMLQRQMTIVCSSIIIFFINHLIQTPCHINYYANNYILCFSTWIIRRPTLQKSNNSQIFCFQFLKDKTKIVLFNALKTQPLYYLLVKNFQITIPFSLLSQKISHLKSYSKQLSWSWVLWVISANISFRLHGNN